MIALTYRCNIYFLSILKISVGKKALAYKTSVGIKNGVGLKIGVSLKNRRQPKKQVLA